MSIQIWSPMVPKHPMTSIAMKPLLWTPFGTFLMICAKAWRGEHRWCFTARSQKAPKYDSKIKKTRIEHPTWIKQFGCLLLFWGSETVDTCWYQYVLHAHHAPFFPDTHEPPMTTNVAAAKKRLVDIGIVKHEPLHLGGKWRKMTDGNDEVKL